MHETLSERRRRRRHKRNASCYLLKERGATLCRVPELSLGPGMVWAADQASSLISDAVLLATMCCRGANAFGRRVLSSQRGSRYGTKRATRVRGPRGVASRRVAGERGNVSNRGKARSLSTLSSLGCVWGGHASRGRYANHPVSPDQCRSDARSRRHA